MKTCKICKQQKPLCEFYRNVSSEDGRRARCKACVDSERKRQKEPGAEEFKLCTICGRLLARGEFGASAILSSGLRSACKKCNAKDTAKWRQEHPEQVAELTRIHREYRKKRYAEDPAWREEVKRKGHDAWHALPLDEKRRRGRQNALITMYGLRPEQFDEMVAKQGGLCGCCGRKPKRLEVDHDHDTGEVRGLLCGKCNSGIGLMGDSIEGLEQGIRYLKHR